MQSRQDIACVNGARLHYQVTGTGPALVLIHGNTLDIRMWSDQVAVFAERYQVICYEMRGFGKSTVPGGEAYAPADDLALLLSHLGVAHAHILGLSLGGAVAIDFALAYPAMTAALLVADAGLREYPWQAYGAFSADVRSAAVAFGVEEARRRWLAGPLFSPAMEHPELAVRLRQMVADYSGWHWLNRELLQPLAPPAIDRLESISSPTLVIVGERDLPEFHAIAGLVQRRVPAASLAMMSGVGHMSNMEDPVRFNALVLDFLAANGSR